MPTAKADNIIIDQYTKSPNKADDKNKKITQKKRENNMTKCHLPWWMTRSH